MQGEEECDDGNTVDGDGCSADCIAGGAPLWEARWEGAGEYDDIYDVVVDADHRIHALGVTGDGDAIDSVLLAIEPDGAITTTSELAPFQSIDLVMRDDGAIAIPGWNAELELPGIRTYDADGTMLWELLDDTHPGMFFSQAVWLDDGGIAAISMDLDGATVISRVSTDGELISSEAVLQGEPYGVARDGDRLFVSGVDVRGSGWLIAVESSDALAWSNLDDGPVGLAVTPGHEILGIDGAAIDRYDADGGLLGAYPYAQSWWNLPMIAIDPSGDVLLAGVFFAEIEAYADCQVTRLGPDLVQKWSRIIESASGCNAITSAPDGTLIVVGAGHDTESFGWAARLAP